jgi:hypothetical protein
MATSEEERKTNKVCDICGSPIRLFGRVSNNMGVCSEKCCKTAKPLEDWPTLDQFNSQVTVFKNIDKGDGIRLVSVTSGDIRIVLENGNYIHVDAIDVNGDTEVNAKYMFKHGGHKNISFVSDEELIKEMELEKEVMEDE